MSIKNQVLKFLPTFFLSVIFLLLLIEILWPNNFLEKAKNNVASWPRSAKSHLRFSQALFQAGHQDLAEKEMRLAQKSLKITTSEKLFQETEAIITEPEKIQEEINSAEEILKEKPWYRDIFLNLAILYDRLYQEEKSQEYFENAFYLDPLNKEVQKIGKALGFL